MLMVDTSNHPKTLGYCMGCLTTHQNIENKVFKGTLHSKGSYDWSASIAQIATISYSHIPSVL